MSVTVKNGHVHFMYDIQGESESVDLGLLNKAKTWETWKKVKEEYVHGLENHVKNLDETVSQSLITVEKLKKEEAKKIILEAVIDLTREGTDYSIFQHTSDNRIEKWYDTYKIEARIERHGPLVSSSYGEIFRQYLKELANEGLLEKIESGWSLDKSKQSFAYRAKL